MKQLYIVANWKENLVETTKWFDEGPRFVLMNGTTWGKQAPNKMVIVCPPFTLLSEVRNIVKSQHLPIKMGAQTISQFSSGSHTGEEAGELLKEFVEYVIIGHSERRALGETDDILQLKVDQAKKSGLIPIYCVSKPAMPVPDGVTIVAYEPIAAIGTGHPDTPENANNVAGSIRNKYPNIESVLYGGSVNGENVASFTNQEFINGVLVGNASLEAESFLSIVKNA